MLFLLAVKLRKFEIYGILSLNFLGKMKALRKKSFPVLRQNSCQNSINYRAKLSKAQFSLSVLLTIFLNL